MALLKKLLRWWRRAVQRPRRRRPRARVRKRRPRPVRRSRPRRPIRRVLKKKRRPVKKPRRFKKAAVRKTAPRVKTVEAGAVTHYFGKVRAAVVKLKGPLKLGDPVWIKGAVTDFRQTVGSLQIDRRVIEKAGAGAEIGLEVMKEVRPGDKVYVLKT